MDAELFRIGVGGVVPVQWDAEKSGTDPGTLTGWASVYNVVDQQDDVVVPGAFRKTLSDWRASKRVIGLTLDHQNDADGVIGALTDAHDSAYGLKTTFRFSSTAKAQDARTKAREGILNGLSFFGPIVNKGFDTVAGKSVQVLKEVGLWFVGLTPMPANTGALVLAAKTGTDEGAEGAREVIRLSAGWVSDMKAALAITSPVAQKAAVDTLVADVYGAAPTVGGGGNGHNPAGDDPVGVSTQDSTQDEDDAARFALALIGESGPVGIPPGGEPSDSLADLLTTESVVDLSADLDALAAQTRQTEGA
jgi:HK97 family phage prohead protease